MAAIIPKQEMGFEEAHVRQAAADSREAIDAATRRQRMAEAEAAMREALDRSARQTWRHWSASGTAGTAVCWRSPAGAMT